MDDQDLLNMSDEAFMEMGEPSDITEPEPENLEPASDSDAGDQPEPEEQFEETEHEAEPEEEPEYQEEAEDSDEEDDTGSDESDEAEPETDDSEVDYKAFHEKLTAPFKANGRDMKVESVDDAVRLMQMGANYNKKMSSLKPNLKLMKMLDNNGLLDEAKLSYLIDLEKKNPDAVKKFVKESGVDAYELDDNEEVNYKPNSYAVDDTELALDDVLEEIKSTPTYAKTLNVVNEVWDEASKRTIASNPEALAVLNEQIGNGVYDKVTAEIEKERMLGRLSGLSDVEAYRQVGNRLFEQGNFNQENPPTKESPDPTPKTSPRAKQTAKRKRAAASPRSAAASKTPSFNPLAMSDEEFEKQFSDSYI
ncbi:hypothetical protein [Alteromonas sp. BMJM2]|uniref:hypothetical protein n=1 Tax=Alteromonas sp. BMJM2 TaxID=2954241 RepID=UPI0022B342CC|nr:hypothetical protein [Alteromonas sp. BMJM2]